MCMVILAVPALLTVFDTLVFKEKAITDKMNQKALERLRKRAAKRHEKRKELMARIAQRRQKKQEQTEQKGGNEDE